MFSRLVDALFFHMDQNCDVPGLRGTGIIEPSKYIWMSIKMGVAEQSVRHFRDLSVSVLKILVSLQAGVML